MGVGEHGGRKCCCAVSHSSPCIGLTPALLSGLLHVDGYLSAGRRLRRCARGTYLSGLGQVGPGGDRSMAWLRACVCTANQHRQQGVCKRTARVGLLDVESVGDLSVLLLLPPPPRRPWCGGRPCRPVGDPCEDPSRPSLRRQGRAHCRTCSLPRAGRAAAGSTSSYLHLMDMTPWNLRGSKCVFVCKLRRMMYWMGRQL